MCPTCWFTLRSHMFRSSSFNIFSTGGDSTYRSENDMPYVHICILYIQLWIMIFNLHIFCIWTSIFLHLLSFEPKGKQPAPNLPTTKQPKTFFSPKVLQSSTTLHLVGFRPRNGKRGLVCCMTHDGSMGLVSIFTYIYSCFCMVNL